MTLMYHSYTLYITGIIQLKGLFTWTHLPMFFSTGSPWLQTKACLRKMVIEMVLATDMKQVWGGGRRGH